MTTITRVEKPAQKKNKQKREPIPAWRVIAAVLLLAIASSCFTGPMAIMMINEQRSQAELDTHREKVGLLSPSTVQDSWSAAERYNQRLYAKGASAIGEAIDPFAKGANNSFASNDEEYKGLLNPQNDGVMAELSYPRLGINMAVRHGTSDEVLQSAAGHLYGTSLPVGGANTHAVFAAHSGLASRILFDRLSMGEAKVGDKFAVLVMGQILHYEVEEIRVVDPSDFSGFVIEPGRDLVTLLTCTPYGINKDRMLVTGKRVPGEEPPVDLPPEGLSTTAKVLLAATAAVWGLFALVAGIELWLLRRRKRQQREKEDSTQSTHIASRENED